MLHPTNRIISIRRLGFHQKEKKFVKEILSAMNFDIMLGEKVGIVDFSDGSSNILLKILAGIYVPTTGEGLINGYSFGHDMIKNSTIFIDIENSIYFKPEDNIKRTIEKIIKYYNLKQENLKEKITNVEKKVSFSIKECDNRKYKELLPIQRLKLHLILVLLIKPVIVLFDKSVTTGSIEKEALYNLINLIHDKRKVTLIFESSNFTSLEKICSRILILRKGRIFGVGSINYWYEKIEQHPMLVLKGKDNKKIKEIISNELKFVRIESNAEKNLLTVILNNEKDIKSLIETLNNFNSEITFIERINPSFEKNFNNYVVKNELFL